MDGCELTADCTTDDKLPYFWLLDSNSVSIAGSVGDKKEGRGALVGWYRDEPSVVCGSLCQELSK